MINSGNAIEVKDVKKKFKVYYDKGSTLKEKLLHASRNKYEEREVLKGISFSVKKGEAVGLIGHNGCGKSTTLKLLTRIIYPDAGTVELQGRVSSLLELGAGFHPDMSGRENVYINASIFGLKRKEIEQRMADIITFSELADYMDNPVRTYSSGMYMRLAFSVAIHVNADILLIDEILAVGDVNFQAKCLHKLIEIKRQGTTIVLVSHSPEQIEQMCERSIWIQDGRIRADGTAREVHQQYLKFMGESRRDVQKEEAENRCGGQGEKADKNTMCQGEVSNSGPGVEFKERARGNGDARITCIYSYGTNNQPKSVFESGSEVTFRVKYKIYKKPERIWFGLCIFRNDGLQCFGTNTKISGMQTDQIEDEGEFSICYPKLELLAGKYYVDVCVATGDDEMLDYLAAVNDFEVYQTTGEIGVCRMPYEWHLDGSLAHEV